MTGPIDLDALERQLLNTPRTLEFETSVRVLIAELRAARKVVEAGNLKWALKMIERAGDLSWTEDDKSRYWKIKHAFAEYEEAT